MPITDNVDRSEIEKFSALASRWWDLQGEFKPLHQINPLRLDFIQRQLQGVYGLRGLDIGCGGGILTEALAQAGAQMTGIDLAEASIEVARLHALEQQLSIDYQTISAEAFAANHAAQFDFVTCMEMLEHVPDPAAIIAAAASSLKPGGWLLVSTLNRNYKAWLLGIVAAEYVLQWVPKGTHQLDKFIQPAELLRMTDAVALEARAMTGLHYLPWRGFFLSDRNVDVNYLIALQKRASCNPG